MDLSTTLGGFPEQQQRPAAPFIDPSFLTANTLQRQRPGSAQSESIHLLVSPHLTIESQTFILF